MPNLVQITYSSMAMHPMSREEIQGLLYQAQQKNRSLGVTGMLLYSEGSFFQVLEGPEEELDRLFHVISHDKRHKQVTEIIREFISKRDFSDWSMGYTEISSSEAESILEINDFFSSGHSLTQLPDNRARKLLQAFKNGSWRTTINNGPILDGAPVASMLHQSDEAAIIQHPTTPSTTSKQTYSFAYQPIIDTLSQTIFSYEALVRGCANEPASEILQSIPTSDMHKFDEECRIHALRLAAQLGLNTRLNMNFLPQSVDTSPTAISSVIAILNELNLKPGNIVIELLEREFITDYKKLRSLIDECRSAGITFAIDDFGSGYAGLNMLAEIQPNLVKLDMDLIREIHYKGPRQAIVRGTIRTCQDLGINIIAEGVESINEYQWLSSEEIHLFQGNLFARPEFETLTTEFMLPSHVYH